MSGRRWVAGVAGIAVMAAALGGCGQSSPARTPRLSVVPRTGLVDRARTITISGLAPGEHVTLDARTLIEGTVWTSRTTYAASRNGTVDVSSAVPTSGAYHTASGMGPFWSESYRHGRSAGTLSADFSTLTATTGRGRSTSATVTQTFRGAGVRAQPMTLAHQGFVGEYFTPAVLPRGGPAMILWGGSEGGDSRIALAELLASHGIPALAIAYFDEPGLPCSLANIPMEYFVKAIRWLKRQPGVDAARVWAWGVSRGSEPLGFVATHFPGLLHGLVDESGSSVLNASYAGTCQPPGFTLTAWTFHGHPLPFDQAYGSDTLVPKYARPASIAFARFHGPVLLVSGSDDSVWPSDRYEDVIMGELSGDPAPHVHLNYAGAGHADLNPPGMPIITQGGTVAGYEAAELQDWPAMLRFVNQH